MAGVTVNGAMIAVGVMVLFLLMNTLVVMNKHQQE
jgi:hypothetical protein